MPYPSKPSLGTSYTAVEQSIGDGSFPGQELDVDLVALRDGVGELVDFVRLFARPDGKLANGSVTTETLAPSVLIGFDPPTPWATNTEYTTSSTVFEGYGFYLCLVAHTSGTFATDLDAGRWLLLADLTPAEGALIAGNNLSDLADAATARGNLGLGSMATANSGTGSSQYRTNAQNDARFVLTTDIGTSVQAYDAELAAIAALAVTDGNIIVGDGTTWVAESGSTARASLGLGTIATQESSNVAITGGTITTTGRVALGAELAEKVFALTGTTPVLDPANGTIQNWILTAASAPTFGAGWSHGESMTLLIDPASGFAVTWPDVVWASGAAPALPQNVYTTIRLRKLYGVWYGAVEVSAPPLGVRQTWQDVTGSRTAGTSYQNTTGRSIQVAITNAGTGTSFHVVSVDGAAWLNVAQATAGGLIRSAHFIVPNGWYYRASSLATSITWLELR